MLDRSTRLGVYEIQSAIGAGGMGEVYRATDTNLRREVAIKLLPEAFAQDPERVARFEREAKTLASLNHPNIAIIHGLEKSQGTYALVMELVEGEDLSQRIARGPIPLDEALPIAKQIAEALEAAHEQGIIHRDLKPANIKVRPDGTVKVLDFGLAKLTEAGASGRGAKDVTQSPTITSPAMLSGVGVLLGTAAYMSPEQAKGRAVDKRADIWAFGVILHEMLTGGHPFLADTIPETLAHVMTRQIDLGTLPAATPRRVRDLLARCLDKDPKKRLRDIGEARIRLEEVLSGGAEEPSSPADAIATAAPGSRIRERLAWGAAAACALLAGVAGTWALRPRATPPETSVDIITPATVQPSSFALSPDGRQIVFVASDDKASHLWLRSLSTTTAQTLAGTEGASYPFWSPDSKSVGFFAGGALKRLDLGGGAPQTLAPAINGSGGTWNADGVIVFAPSLTTPLMRVSAAGGAAIAVTKLDPQEYGHFQPQFMPDGQRLLFTVGGSTDTAGIYMGRLNGSSPTRLVSDLSSGVYTPAGWLLWVRAGALMAQRLDVDRPAVTGEPLTLADGIPFDASLRSAVSVATTGLVAYRASKSALRQLTWFDRSGTARGVIGEPDDTLLTPRLSPDDRRVAETHTVQGNQDIWLVDGARASRFTFDTGQDSFPVWSPDNSRLVYMSRRTGTGIGALYHKLTNGAGVEEQLLSTDQVLAPASWSADGRFLLYLSFDPKTNTDLWVMPMTGEDRKPFVFLKTPFREAYGVFSPDGRWVAYHSNETGRPEIYVRPFVPPGATGTAATAAGGQWQVSTAGGIHPLWRSDGKELYYINPDGAMMAAPINVNGATVEPGAPVMLFPTRIVGGGADIQQGRQYDVTADGRFLINTVLNEAAAPITLLQNWKAPTK
jgi:eukaryotic-like serine/threonine-protein kinase